MAGATTKGYPYPTGTDRVTDGDNAIQSLAEAVDSKLGVAASGTGTSPSLAAGATGTVTITFPVGRFPASSVPVMTVTHQAIGQPNGFAVSVGTASNVNCGVGCYRAAGSGTFTFTWIAILVA